MSAATSSRSCATCWRSRSSMTKDKMKRQVQAKAELAAEERVLDALVGEGAERRHALQVPQDAAQRRARRQGDRARRSRTPAAAMPTFEIPGMPGASIGMINLNEMLGNALRRPHQEAQDDGARRLCAADRRGVRQAARPGEGAGARRSRSTEQNGIVFIDEIDKICARSERMGADVSREGVQRDLLPLIEGTTVSTKHGAGEDRPHPVHRLGRLPPRQARPTCCPNCRAACRSASS